MVAFCHHLVSIPEVVLRLGGWQQAVRRTGASKVDANGRCQAFCLPVLGGGGGREIPAFKCSLEERHQHLLGKQMESCEWRGDGHGAAECEGGGGIGGRRR